MNTKIITIAQQKGGAGKTTVSAHLAIGLVQAKKTVACLDLDPQASLSTWARMREVNGVVGNEVSCKACNAYALEEEIEKLNGKVDYIIIDSPPHIEVEARQAIRSADLVLIPVQPSPTDLWATKASIILTEQEGVTAKILLNRVSGNSNLGKSIRAVFEASHKDKLLKAQLGNRVGFAAAILDGQTITEAQPSSTAAREVKAFVKEIEKVFAVKKEAKKEVKKTAAKATKKAVKKKAA